MICCRKWKTSRQIVLDLVSKVNKLKILVNSWTSKVNKIRMKKSSKACSEAVGVGLAVSMVRRGVNMKISIGDDKRSNTQINSEMLNQDS